MECYIIWFVVFCERIFSDVIDFFFFYKDNY